MIKSLSGAVGLLDKLENDVGTIDDYIKNDQSQTRY